MSEPRYYIKIDGKWYRTVEGASTYGGKATLLAWSPSHPERDSRIIKALEEQLEDLPRKA
ncbi:unnamed protein product [marine sediment metagenome]|uniref:Uncharacterized protein n=1 Tax=marine sediment metagenome TaxID=412755 RepID=X1N3L0_9ZZZZ